MDAVGRFRSVLIFGASSDIGGALARALAARGSVRFALAARDTLRADRLAADLRSMGTERAEVISFDACDIDAHGPLLDRCAGLLGDIDLAVIAVGVLGDQDRFDADPSAAAQATIVNYSGAVSLVLHAAGRMREQGRGTIVVLSTIAGMRVRRVHPVYGSSKGAIDRFALALGDRLAGTGVEVAVVRPGFVSTRMTDGMKPAPFATNAEQVAAATIAGLERSKRVIWVPPIVRFVALGLRLLPHPVFRRIPI